MQVSIPLFPLKYLIERENKWVSNALLSPQFQLHLRTYQKSAILLPWVKLLIPLVFHFIHIQGLITFNFVSVSCLDFPPPVILIKPSLYLMHIQRNNATVHTPVRFTLVNAPPDSINDFHPPLTIRAPDVAFEMIRRNLGKDYKVTPFALLIWNWVVRVWTWLLFKLRSEPRFILIYLFDEIQIVRTPLLQFLYLSRKHSVNIISWVFH